MQIILRKIGANLSALDGHSIIAVGPKRIDNKQFNPNIKVNNMSLVAELTAKNVGIGILDQGIADQFISNGQHLIPIFEDTLIAKTQIHLIYPHRNPPARVKKLIEFIVNKSDK